MEQRLLRADSPMTEKRTVLLVESDPVLRRAIRQFLDFAGYEVIDVEGVDDARHQVPQRARIDAIVVELYAPGPPVEDLVRLVRRAHPHAITIVCTARTSLTRRVSLRQAGVDALVPKIDLATHLLPELAARLG
jgi:DNA-binding response OmpR family regulator